MMYASVLNVIICLNKYLSVFIDFMGIFSFIFASSNIFFYFFEFVLRKRNNTIIKMGSIVAITLTVDFLYRIYSFIIVIDERRTNQGHKF